MPMLRRTIPLLKNFPLGRTAGPALKKVHLPHELPAEAKAEVIFETTIDPFDPKTHPIYDTHPVPPSGTSPVEFGNRIKRKHLDQGAGRNTMSPVLCIDLFTMLDTQPLAKVLQAEIGKGVGQEMVPEQLQSLAELWRQLQVQYTWRLNAMDEYKPFSELIPLALRDALSQHNLADTVTDKALSALTAAFLSLPTSSDVRPFLNSLSNNTSHQTLGKNTYVHSNAPLSVMDTLITSNPSTLAEFFYHPGRIRSIDTANECPKRFKPHPRAYEEFAHEAGVKAPDVVLVTSHKWDVVGAKKAGWRVVWVDRKNEGWSDGLGVGMSIKPDWVVESLDGMQKVFEAL